jgi:hypothetical protein
MHATWIHNLQVVPQPLAIHSSLTLKYIHQSHATSCTPLSVIVWLPLLKLVPLLALSNKSI